MSGVYIKGMKMPATCCHCPLMGYDPDIWWNDGGRKTQGAYICVLTHELIDNTKREEHCPLVEIPPHGRLIDADALMHEFEKAQHTMQQHGREYSCSFMSSSQELSTEWYCVEDMLENAPTILEAEEAEWTKDNICSRCGDEACAGYDEEPWLTRYCPHCGAKMKNSEDYE